MELLNLIFHLGVLFSIYGFLWFFIDLALKILVAGRVRSLSEVYLIKSIKYLFLVNVTFLFCLDNNQNEVSVFNLLPTILVLVVYFIGKLQKNQRKKEVFGSLGGGIIDNTFNLKAEIVLISCSVLLFILLLYFPQFASNHIANWFHDSIIDIEKTFIGFFFKLIGFFFLVSMLVRMLNAIVYIISGKPFIDIQSSFKKGVKKENSDRFDDFEEVE